MKTLKLAILTMAFATLLGVISSKEYQDMQLEDKVVLSHGELIDTILFPSYMLADSIEGVDSRGTDIWCSIASQDN